MSGRREATSGAPQACTHCCSSSGLPISPPPCCRPAQPPYLGAVLQQVAVVGAHHLSADARKVAAPGGVLDAVDERKGLPIPRQRHLEVPALEDCVQALCACVLAGRGGCEVASCRCGRQMVQATHLPHSVNNLHPSRHAWQHTTHSAAACHPSGSPSAGRVLRRLGRQRPPPPPLGGNDSTAAAADIRHSFSHVVAVTPASRIAAGLYCQGPQGRARPGPGARVGLFAPLAAAAGSRASSRLSRPLVQAARSRWGAPRSS